MEEQGPTHWQRVPTPGPPVSAGPCTVSLRFLDLDEARTARLMVADVLYPEETRKGKVRALASMGITVQEGEKPLHCWLDAMHRENGFPPQTPAHPRIADAIFADMGASRFIFALA